MNTSGIVYYSGGVVYARLTSEGYYIASKDSILATFTGKL